MAKGSKSNIPRVLPPVDDVLIKNYGYYIFNEHFTESWTESDVIDVGNRLFKTITGLTVSGHLSAKCENWIW